MWSSPPALQTAHYWADRERRRETLRWTEEGREEREDEERSSIQLIKFEDSGFSLRCRFLSSTPAFPCQFPFSSTPPPLTPYFAKKMAGAGALKSCFNRCWQGVDQQKPKPEDLLEKIQSDMFSLRLIGGLGGGRMGGMWGWRDWRQRCEWVWLFHHTITPTPFPHTPPCFPLSFWAIVSKCPLNDAKEQTPPPSHFPPPPPSELWVLFQGGGMWWAREQDYSTLIGSDLSLLMSDLHTHTHRYQLCSMIGWDNHVLIMTQLRRKK